MLPWCTFDGGGKKEELANLHNVSNWINTETILIAHRGIKVCLFKIATDARPEGVKTN